MLATSRLKILKASLGEGLMRREDFCHPIHAQGKDISFMHVP